MSTTDTRAAFEAHIQKECRTDYESYLVVQRFDRKPEEYQLEKVQSRWKTWQAATEAAKATGTAGDEGAAKRVVDYIVAFDAGLTEKGFTHAQRLEIVGLLVSEATRKEAEAARQPAPVAAVKLMTMQEVIDAMHGNNLLTDIGYSALLNGDYIEATLEYITQVINYAAIPAIAATNRSQP